MSTRRAFIGNSTGAIAALATAQVPAKETSTMGCATEVVSLSGEWLFRVDPNDVGVRECWFGPIVLDNAWRIVRVPHTWQIEPGLADYQGVGWYLRSFDAPERWRLCAVRVEFEGIFHSATVWVNSKPVGEHERKGYTAFTLDITPWLQTGYTNIIALRVNNVFSEQMLPRGRSSDWAHDGGIFRPVQLLVTPATYVERTDVDAQPDLPGSSAKLAIASYIRNASGMPWKGTAELRITAQDSGSTALAHTSELFSVSACSTYKLSLDTILPNAKLWHFDSPNLYHLECSISDGKGPHRFTTIFGVRRFEIRGSAFYLNGERVRLMGVERMAGSNPQFGMAEPAEWVDHDHEDMKHLNCVFTRVHWPQDKRVLDYCDRHGILMQAEIPVWGFETFAGMTAQPSDDILQNGLEQLREMIARDRNHPSIVSWGLCNEINGQNPPAYYFAKRMLEEAKNLDPGRLCSYASNSLVETPQRDVAALMDFIETNEYYGTWAPGTAEDAGRHLDRLHIAFPDKPIVVSEYGYCACTPDRPEDDQKRMEILATHQNAIRSRDFVAGAIFFCYNDYRTHAGDRGLGSYRQRVHGVVNIFGTRKPSFELLRRESSPVESVSLNPQSSRFEVRIKTRHDFPIYTLRGYKIRAVFFGQGNIPVEHQELALPHLAPGDEMRWRIEFTRSESPVRMNIDVLRPTGFSVYSKVWQI